jgi:hypothetical protein
MLTRSYPGKRIFSAIAVIQSNVIFGDEGGFALEYGLQQFAPHSATRPCSTRPDNAQRQG